MKVRWTRDHLRLRITPSELEMILQGKPVTERFQFSGGPGWEAAVVPAERATEARMGPGRTASLLVE